uniref:Snaclec CHH-B subunit alpha n=1 Tax=Crotalus horridus TaxID=35024 RepID=SLA_CROHD|nr:RecName: Full=Snaclec CHH-B subunit alpha [Crotalus horridus]
DLECPSGWSSYDRYCYKPFKQEMTWADAERFCSEQAKGRHLLSVETALEASFVDNVLYANKEYLTRYIWIGLRVQNKGQPCSSIYSENLVDPFDCFMVSRDTRLREWFKVDCEQQHSFICKFTRPRR